MEFTGSKNNKKYKMVVKNLEVDFIEVESTNSCERWYYQRGPVKMGIAIDKQIFEEAVIAICKENPEDWDKLYKAIRYDLEYARMMQRAYKNFIGPFLKTQIHRDAFWREM